jgi:ParB family chromosome partitioning protein
MAESMGAGTGAAMPEIPASPGSGPISGPGAVASKHDGVKPLREARVIRLENLARDPEQPRQVFDAESLDRLAKSLISRGQLQPIRVRWSQDQGKYLIVAGERRWRAAMLAGMESLHAVVVERELTAPELLQEQLVENCLREDLQPIEQACAFRALMDANGWSARRIADELHLANSTVIKALSLLELDPAVREQVNTGALAPAAAYEVSKLENPVEQREVAGRVVAEGLTRDETAEVVREKSGRAAKERAEGGQGSSAGRGKAARVQFQVEGGTTVTVAGAAAAAGIHDVVLVLEVVLELARREADRDLLEIGEELAALRKELDAQGDPPRRPRRRSLAS